MNSRPSLLVIVALLAAGCERSGDTYRQAVANAVTAEPNVVAFQKLYPVGKHFISYYTGEVGTPRWNSESLIHERYILTMQFDVTVDESGTQVTAASQPQFLLVEVSAVTTTPNGQTSYLYEGASQLQFGVQQWGALEAGSGDLSVLGIEVKRDQPVPNLSDHWMSVYPYPSVGPAAN